jgi:DNA invertase Pin-like site-specific DNA recombinase
MSKSLRAALYARFSTDKQSSTADQLRVCARIAEGAKFEVVRSFTDLEHRGSAPCLRADC